jgi:hypothetical protein
VNDDLLAVSVSVTLNAKMLWQNLIAGSKA